MIYLLLFALFSTSDSLLQQGESEVQLADLDAYVFLLPPEKRAGFINDKTQIEKNIITMTNINIVYDYLMSSGIYKDEIFVVVDDLIDKQELNLDDEFHIKLGIKREKAIANVKSFLKKQEYYARMIQYLKSELNNGKINDLAKEYFTINSDRWVVPEKRDLSIIQLDINENDAQSVKTILLDLVKNPSLENFEKQALAHSSDPTVSYNKGHLSEFREVDLKYPFTDKIFSADLGVIPTVFKYDEKYFIVRVNKIIEKVEPKFADYEKSIKENLVEKTAETQFQNIINSQAIHKIEVNSEVMAHAFERYKVLLDN